MAVNRAAVQASRRGRGGLLILFSQPLRLMIAGTPAWMAFAEWLTR
jgi:hypothetical protein